MRRGARDRRRRRHPPDRGRTAPLQCAAYIHPAVDAQALTVRAALEHDREAIYHAVLQDPIVQARLTLDDAWRLTDELIAAELEWLPAWLGGAAISSKSRVTTQAP